MDTHGTTHGTPTHWGAGVDVSKQVAAPESRFESELAGGLYGA